MSTSVTVLTSIVYELCEVEKDNLTDKEQYEAYIVALLAQVNTIKRTIFIQSLAIVNEQEYRQFIVHKYRTLTALASLLKEALSKKENEDSFDALLLKEVLTQTRVLIYFVRAHFPQALKISGEGQQLPSIEKIKLDVTSGAMAAITKAFVKSTPNISNKSQEEILPYIVAHFNSKKTDDIAITTFKKNYYSPAPADIGEAIIFLTKMIRYLRNLKI
ncbi:hypothetical protein GO495_09465 [Chitinophaga oryziterrae]|uniref:Uncharacterized protein n=1 Tax=Chitinophaga oryziterrae TaxID=1031224 RepID=A0A6N8J6B0_9BACT|nr:hypothetical protein [Chitinophaga oryziterrae]MVT40805.1 hypothetical protein [Chitinophaga oryziterrae]